MEANWSALCAGESLAAADPHLDGLPVDFSCRVRDFDAEAELGRARARRLDPPARFAIAAARRAVAHAGLDHRSWEGDRVGVVLGVGSNSLDTYGAAFGHLGAAEPERVSPLALPRSVPNMVAAEVAMDLGAGGPNFTTASACASGTTALGIARDLLRSHACDIVLAGGSESGCSPMSATCFARMRALSRRRQCPRLASRPFDAERDGFVLGEGAAVFALERRSTAQARRAPVLAMLRGYGASCDAHHPVSPHPGGDGIARALRAAIDDGDCVPAGVGQ
ncbi:beta-ketoacyl synthase N-terminal-like domain-containing protein [Streptomyces sp. NPDC046215]|uniref:beta-ketoacyl-[acyl-carrier-protein] synthase family protein n=1 Tax=Streptomyces sp. NPDC046215 TaxID=3155774 RepID=UPI0031DF3B51